MVRATRRTTTDRQRPAFTARFKQWLTLRDEAGKLDARREELRLRFLADLAAHGEKDDKGNMWYDLPQPVMFEDHTGKKFRWVALKRQRSLIPANPQPDEDLTEEWLSEHDLWLTEEQDRVLNILRNQLPFANIEISVNTDAVASAYLTKRIKMTSKEYEALLPKQEERFSFVPVEER